jgi:N-acetylmuramoyl-L-alanine amidase/putative methionine-R-sulfoxide reductase with GAF domain
MGTIPTKAQMDISAQLTGSGASLWPRSLNPSVVVSTASIGERSEQPSRRDALQALLAFSALHEQVRRRRALACRHKGFELVAPPGEFESGEQFVLDEVLQLVAERAVGITGADGLAIALAENNEIVLRASAGTIKPDVGARIDRDSAFSGACFRLAQIIRCDDVDMDDRVNVEACRRLGARSMVAVPLCGRRRVIGLLEAFSAEAHGFNDSDVRSLELLAELVLGALKPEDEDRFAESAAVAASTLESVPTPAKVAEAAVAPVEKHSLNEFAPAAGESAAVDDEPILLEELLAATGPQSATPISVDEDVLEEPCSSPEKGAKPVPIFRGGVRSLETVADDGGDEQIETSRHPGLLVVLVLIVIVTLAALGWWWKAKNAQIGSAMVQSVAKPTTKSTAGPTSTSSATGPSAPSSLNASTSSNPSTAIEPVIPGDGSADSGANPEELSRMPLVTGIRHWSSNDSSTVVLDLQDQVQYEAHRLAAPDRIYFDLHDTALAPELSGKTIDVGDALLSRIRVAQPVPGMTRVVLETKGSPNFSVSLEPNPYRLVVEVRKIGTEPKAKIDLFPGAAEAEKDKMAIIVPPPTREDLQLRAKVPRMRIVVDAGHGGWDLGTVGRRGLLEKDLVLEIAQRLGKLLESRLGAEVVLTRNDDSYIPLDERAGIANQAQADLFISVHANYSDLPSARGVETYYTNLFNMPGAKDADAHDAHADDSSKEAAAATLSPAELHDKIEQSRRLAASVQRSLYGSLASRNPGLRDRGVKEASYVVLTETAMPGILAEVSFVSSPTDEQKLRSDGYREHIAEALYRGIARYAASSRRSVKIASK